MSKIKWIEGGGYLVVITPGKAPKNISVDSKIYKKIKKAIEKDNLPLINELLFPTEELEKKTKGILKIKSTGEVLLKNKIINPVIAQIGKDLLEKGYPLEPLIALDNNICNSRNEWVKEQLFRFLKFNKSPITKDGCFIGYKGVHKIDEHLYDCYTHRILNDIGLTVSMPYSEVTKDPHQSCSTGLHVASNSYVFSCYPNKTHIIVKVNPKDVVSVPYDYENQKIRVCKYKVLGLLKDSHKLEDIYFQWDNKPKKVSHKSKVSVMDLSKMTASAIIDYVLSATDIIIPISPKSKRTVIKYALKYLEDAGYKVDGTNVEIRKNLLTQKKEKEKVVSIKGLSAKDILDKVINDLKYEITFSIKSKRSIVKKAIQLYTEKGYKIEHD